MEAAEEVKTDPESQSAISPSEESSAAIVVGVAESTIADHDELTSSSILASARTTSILDTVPDDVKELTIRNLDTNEEYVIGNLTTESY